jgi:hypothetical protein
MFLFWPTKTSQNLAHSLATPARGHQSA